MAEPLSLRGDHITLANALKVTGAVPTGGQGKLAVREGDVKVNGVAETRPGRKLRAGDTFSIGGREWVIQA